MAELQKPDKKTVDGFRGAMLSWYDAHYRPMPWRAPPGERPDPYHDWLSEIMLQQTTVYTVKAYFEKFIDKWPTIHDLAKAAQEEVMHEWAGLGYYARARNLHKCAKIVSEERGGVFPDNEEELKKLPGIGDYTAAAITSIAFDKPAVVMDGNIERVMARIFAISEPLPTGKKLMKQGAFYFADRRTDRPGDYAQSLMDLGAVICTPTKPACGLCPVRPYCAAQKKGIAESLPVRAPKKAKPVKYGTLYWMENKKGEILAERRPETEMLGGMLGLPTSDWTLEKPENSIISGQIRHSFTHFDLYLDIVEQDAPKNKNNIWIKRTSLPESGLPTLFQKAVNLMMQKGI